jgi:hypothetical protein
MSTIKKIVCLVRGHVWVRSQWHDEGQPLDECSRCGTVNA